MLKTHDVDDWLAIIAAGGGSIGITPEGTTTQYRRDGVVFRPLRDAPPIAVQMIWRRQDPHPSTHEAIALLSELYKRRLGWPVDSDHIRNVVGSNTIHGDRP
jgi:DNA-binding transcriptional LysR family regulator